MARALTALPPISGWLAGVPWPAWARLDVEVRRSRHAAAEWFPDWSTVRPAHVAALADLRTPEVVGLLLAMHPDGRVRQAAVEVLARSSRHDVLPALLVRASDWVPEVRTPARAAVESRFDGLSTGVILRVLPLVEKLAAPRARGAEWHAALFGRMIALLDRATLVRALGSYDRGVPRTVARLLVAGGEVADDVLGAALAQKDVVVLRILGTAALEQRPDEVADSLLDAIDPGLRASALHHRLRGDPGAADAAAHAALLDRSALVRGLAQHHLARRGVDVAAAYRSRVTAAPRALVGLAEVGTESDAEVVRPFLADPRPSVRALAVTAWARVRPDARPVLLDALGDPAPSVGRAAARSLDRSRLDPATVELLWQWAVDPPHPQVRTVVLLVLGRQDRWVALVVALRALGGDDDLRRRGVALLRGIRDRWSASATAPPPDRLAEARRLVGTRATRLSSAERADLVDLLRPWG